MLVLLQETNKEVLVVLNWRVEWGHSPDLVVDAGSYDHEYAFYMFDWLRKQGWAYVSVQKAG